MELYAAGRRSRYGNFARNLSDLRQFLSNQFSIIPLQAAGVRFGNTSAATIPTSKKPTIWMSM